MRNKAGRVLGLAVVAVATVMVAAIGEGWAEAPARKAAEADAKAPAPKGGLRIGVGAPPKDVRKGVADPLGGAAQKKAVGGAAPAVAPQWPFYATFQLTATDGVSLDAVFYPARGGPDAPVLMLVHQSGTGHSSKDFQEPIESLEGKTLAEHLQQQDYAVFLVDMRPQAAQRRDATQREVLAALLGDLHTAYAFLIDRHNRRELNLSKFGVIAIGDGADLVAQWTAYDGGAVANPGRLSDLGALAMISPPAEAWGTRLAPALTALAPRLPMLLIAGDRDTELAKSAQPVLERHPLSKVAFFETRLQGNRLLGFEPKVVETLTKFLEEPVKFRKNSEWEPRYLLHPIAYSDVQLTPIKEPSKDQPAEPKAKAKAKDQPAEPKAKDQPAPKAKDADG